MLEIKNTEVFGLERAIRASGNAMSIGGIDTQHGIDIFKESFNTELPRQRVKRLGSAPVGSGHDHFLLGIHVQFDIKYPQYWTIEAERYHNFEIITSQSKMHRLTMMGKNLDEFRKMFNQYVNDSTIKMVWQMIDHYNNLCSETSSAYLSVEELNRDKYISFMEIVSNLPMGFEMWMTCDLTYLQLKTMYHQRKNHKLKEDWGYFCGWCEGLPMFKELIGIDSGGK